MELYPYLERVVWLGGEVFLYRHFEEMFDTGARFPRMQQQIITNGYVLNERWIEKMVCSPNTELTFSVDGTTKEVYESIRQGSNFEKLLGNIRLIMKRKQAVNPRMQIRLNAVIMRSNHHQIEEFLEFAHNEGFSQLSLMALHFDMAPEENIFYGSQDRAVLQRIAGTIPRLREKAKSYGVDLDILLPPGDVSFEQTPAEPAAPPPSVGG
jgi:MoaA/NifB/PqqE/SkfB family radical SAM enzyme